MQKTGSKKESRCDCSHFYVLDHLKNKRKSLPRALCETSETFKFTEANVEARVRTRDAPVSLSSSLTSVKPVNLFVQKKSLFLCVSFI